MFAVMFSSSFGQFRAGKHDAYKNSYEHLKINKTINKTITIIDEYQRMMVKYENGKYN